MRVFRNSTRRPRKRLRARRRFDPEEKARILNTNQFPRNLVRFEELKRSCQRGFVIPFVGAGMSKSAGCPEWKEYLLGLCDDARLDAAAMRERLESRGDYEGVMNDLVQSLGENRFNLDFERDFTTPENISGAVTLLPRLFDSCAVTTNFDRVLEQVYSNEGRAFVEKVTGRGMANAFFRAIPAGDRYLLKLHGNLDNAAERVLNHVEYNTAYGDDGNIHFECPLPKLLKRLFISYSFIFLGCSLSADRTMQTFMRVAQLEGQDNLPHHYALLPCCLRDVVENHLFQVVALLAMESPSDRDFGAVQTEKAKVFRAMRPLDRDDWCAASMPATGRSKAWRRTPTSKPFAPCGSLLTREIREEHQRNAFAWNRGRGRSCEFHSSHNPWGHSGRQWSTR